MRFIVYSLLMIIICASVQGLAVTGRQMSISEEFRPYYNRTDYYNIYNREGYVSDYDITVYGPLKDYFTVTPSHIEEVQPGKSTSFRVDIQLPEKIDYAGNLEHAIRITIDTTGMEGLQAVPSVGVKYYFRSLYPYKRIESSFGVADMNVNEIKVLSIAVKNVGEPPINEVYGDIGIYEPAATEPLRTLRTSTQTNLLSWQTKNVEANFDSTGLQPGNYIAKGVLTWDGNKTEMERAFRIGQKNVEITTIPNLFEFNAINKIDIGVKSGWNTKINEIYAQVEIFDDNGKVAEFKTFNYELLPWEEIPMTGYFDTAELEKGIYRMVVVANYDGAKTRKEIEITIDENINAEVVEEIPGQFSLKAIMTPMNLLLALMVVFIGLLLALFITRPKVEKPKPLIDPATINYVKDLRKKYNDDYIKKMMNERGWSSEMIDEVMNLSK